MAETGFKVEGLRELNTNLRKINRELPKGVTQIHKQIAQPVAEVARAKVKSRSGRLAGTVRALATQRAASIAAGRGTMVYAPINHYGGYPGDYEGNPFLEDAITEQEYKMVSDYQRMMGEFIERVWVDHRA